MTFDEFSRKTSGILDVSLSEPEVPIGGAMTQPTRTAKVTAVKLESRVAIDTDEPPYFRDFTAEELDTVIIDHAEISLQSELRGRGAAVKHKAPTSAGFRVRDVLAAIEETERQTRGATNWHESVASSRG